ncbi:MULTISPECIES: RHS repeat-associated core domain-containing protein [Pseudomonas]|uniref:RHS repeat-associated core domain-containing protein n=1 Tax=Pseudomonas TaxID=286 RepID=UPI001E447CFF|nr:MULTISPECIES: RHS repeat-associated core domain-containing protein [Pseudomonas]MCE1117159.1 RHS repeat-associated core domain-containing protein [Pseudomonas sp. NMI795_08]
MKQDFFYQHQQMVTVAVDGVCRSIFQAGEQLLAERRQVGKAMLLATDKQRSVVQGRDAEGNAFKPISYTPYGDSPGKDSDEGILGYTGEQRDGVLPGYWLGNGYRCYWTALGRFGSADSWSPFGRGGINAYAYCSGDPVNYSDPSGHLGWGGRLRTGNLTHPWVVADPVVFTPQLAELGFPNPGDYQRYLIQRPSIGQSARTGWRHNQIVSGNHPVLEQPWANISAQTRVDYFFGSANLAANELESSALLVAQGRSNLGQGSLFFLPQTAEVELAQVRHPLLLTHTRAVQRASNARSVVPKEVAASLTAAARVIRNTANDMVQRYEAGESWMLELVYKEEEFLRQK